MVVVVVVEDKDGDGGGGQSSGGAIVFWGILSKEKTRTLGVKGIGTYD